MRRCKALIAELETGDDNLDTMVERLFKVLRMVDRLSLDYTNFMIMNASATLIRETPGYEQRAFAKDLETGDDHFGQDKAMVEDIACSIGGRSRPQRSRGHTNCI